MKERFLDGNMADVYRIGQVVRKPKPPWWDATRQVLQHLESVGYPWSQHILAEHADAVDFAYIHGNTVAANLHGFVDDKTLRLIGRRIRELHDALTGFRLSSGTNTVPWPVLPPGELIICHNDLSPWNTVMSHGEFQGFIDWDLVSYGTREWDLAWACWRWAPIYPHGNRTTFNASTQVERCQIMLKAYGLDVLVLDHFVDVIDRRMKCALESVEHLGSQGVPGFDRLLATGMHLSGHDDRTWIADNYDIFRTGLETI